MKFVFVFFSVTETRCLSQVEQESERIGKDAMECQVIADDAQADLAVAMPALERAMAEVDKLDKTSITEVKLSCIARVTNCTIRYHAARNHFDPAALRVR